MRLPKTPRCLIATAKFYPHSYKRIGGVVKMHYKATIASTVSILLFLTSCSQFRKTAPTMGGEPPLTGGEGIALVNELQGAFEKVPDVDPKLCQYTIPQHQEMQSEPYARYLHEGKKQNQFVCIRYKTPTSVSQVIDHMEAGFDLSDLYCDTFFRRIAAHSNQRRFARGLVNDAGAAISAVLGLAKVTSPVVGGVGAGFGLADSSFRNYDDSFLVSPDLSTLQTRVYTEQDKFRAAAMARKDIKRFSTANSVILRYANFCSFTGMRGLINRSLNTSSEDPVETLKRFAGYASAYIKAARAVREAAAGNSEDLLSNGEPTQPNYYDQSAYATVTDPIPAVR
jgi:hypothetical protein